MFRKIVLAALLCVAPVMAAEAATYPTCGALDNSDCYRAFAGSFDGQIQASQQPEFSGSGFAYVPLGSSYGYLQLDPGGMVSDSFPTARSRAQLRINFDQIVSDLVVTLTGLSHGAPFTATITGADIASSFGLTYGSSGSLTINVNGFTFQSVTIATSTSSVKLGNLALIPEASTWALMVIGFGAVGLALRRPRRAALA